MKTCTRCHELKQETSFYVKKCGALTSWCRACTGWNSRKWKLANPGRHAALNRNSRIKLRFGVTAAKYEEMLAAQGGVCAICGGRNKDRRLAIDHDHVTGAVRGLLCFRCNVCIPMLESPAKKYRAEQYLKSQHAVSLGLTTCTVG